MDSRIQQTIDKNKEKEGTSGINPIMFVIWLLIIASIMLFAAFSSAYIVHRADGLRNEAWAQFNLPMAFWYSAIIVLLSSLVIEKAYRAAKNDDIYLVPSLVIITLLLGLGFCISQYFGWKSLNEMGFHFSNIEPEGISGSFVHVVVYVHLAHILLGISLLSITLFKSLRLQVHKKNMLFINISRTYWHFLGILWIYLLLFLYFAR